MDYPRVNEGLSKMLEEAVRVRMRDRVVGDFGLETVVDRTDSQGDRK